MSQSALTIHQGRATPPAHRKLIIQFKALSLGGRVSVRPGTDVMILKIFSAENSAKKWRF
jgi:hypothetical protein